MICLPLLGTLPLEWLITWARHYSYLKRFAGQERLEESARNRPNIIWLAENKIYLGASRIVNSASERLRRFGASCFLFSSQERSNTCRKELAPMNL
jgi:hypothetical protein